MKRIGLLLVLAVVLLLVAWGAPAARGHGMGKPQVLNQPAGPYLLSAWTDPDPLRADETHVVVAVIDPANMEPIVTGVEVTIDMTSLADPTQQVTETAGTDYVNQLLYAAEFNDMVSEGRWRVDLSVDGERGAGDGVGFEVDVGPARTFNWLWIGVGGVGLIVVVWMLSAMRGDTAAKGKRRRARPPAR